MQIEERLGQRGGKIAVCKCDQCEKEYSVPAWQPYGKDYCSAKCYHKSKVGKPHPLKGKNTVMRECERCGHLFPTGGEGNRYHTQKYCSKLCSGWAKNGIHNTPKPLSLADAAYLAGMMDGEGSIMLFERDKSISLRVSCANTFKPVLDWIQQTTGVGSVRGGTPEKPDKHKRGFQWQTHSNLALVVLEGIMPHLKIKKEQARIAIEVQKRNMAKTIDREWGLEMCAKVKELNRRGPVLDAEETAA